MPDAVATFSESMPAAVGTVMRASAAARVAGSRPAPSVPNSRTTRGGSGSVVPNAASGVASCCATHASTRNPSARSFSRSPGQAEANANGTASVAAIETRTALRNSGCAPPGAAAVPVTIQYRYREPEYGPRLVRMYLMTNDTASKLGTTPLPDGVVRVFRDNGRGGLSYVAQQPIKYVPIGDKIELNLGPDPEVIFELIKLKVFRTDLWLQIHGQTMLRKIGGDGVMQIENASLVGWADHEIYTQRIRNYTPKDIDVEIRRAFPGHVMFKSQLEPTLHDYQTVEIKTKVAAGKRADLLFEVVRLQGTSAKQNNVTLESTEVKP